MNSDEEIDENEKQNESFEHLDHDSDFELISNNIKDKLILIKCLAFNNSRVIIINDIIIRLFFMKFIFQ